MVAFCDLDEVRVAQTFKDWLDVPFDVAARPAELSPLSNVAVRARRPLEWDSAAMKVTNVAAANIYLTQQYRPGFGV